MKNKENLKENKLSKKEAKSIIYKKLASALSEYNKEIKPKKFDSKLKKASKLFATGIAKASVKKPAEKASKKNTKIKPEQKQQPVS
jgi:hypothetical protein